MAKVRGSHSDNQPRQQRQSLPTRRSKSILTRSSNDDDCNDDNCEIIESRQESQKHDDDESPNDDKKTVDEAIAEGDVPGGNYCGNGTNGEEDVEKRIPSPSSEGNDDSGDKASSVPVDNKKREEDVRSNSQLLQPAFVLKDIGTIDTINANVAIDMNNATEHSSTSITTSSAHQHQHSKYRYRSPSPQSGLVVSRRGRSRDRSPVSLTPRHLSPNKQHSSLSPSTAGGRELSEAALAAGEAAAWSGDTSGGASYHAPQQSQGRRSPSPVSRFPSLSSHSLSLENLLYFTEGYFKERAPLSNEMKIGSLDENGSCGEDEERRIEGGGAAPLGSFDWNIGPSLSREQQHQQQRVPEQHMHPPPPPTHDHYARDDRSSQSSHIGPYPPPCCQYEDNQYRHPPQYQDRDSQYYERYPPSYQPNHNDQYHHDWNHNPDPPPTSHNSHYCGDNTGGYSHHRHDGRYQQQSHYHHNHPDTKSSKHNVDQEYRQYSRSLSSPNQQALFPENHVMSGHSSFKNRHYNQGDTRGSTSSVLRHRHHHHGVVGQDKTRGSSGGEPSDKSSRRSKRKSNASPHRSSVFRGSPSPKDDNLPQELLLALESNEDETHHHTSSTPSSKVPKTSSPSSPSNMLVASQSMLGLEDVFQDQMLADDDYLNDATLSFRKSYDLEQMFSFIKEGNDGPTSSHPNDGTPPLQGQFSFNLGFITSKSMDDEDNKGTIRSKNVKLSDGRKGRRWRKQSSTRNYKNELLLPSIQNLNSDDSTPSLGGLSPTNSFRDVSMGTTDGLALRAFLSSSPQSTDNAPVVHASMPPAYNHEESTRYGLPPDNIDGGYDDANPTHETLSSTYPNNGHGKPSPASIEIKKGFSTVRIKLSTRHTLHPIARDLLNRFEGDYFFLLKKLAPCFVGFRFKLPEIESACYDPSIPMDDSKASGAPETLLGDVQMSVAMRRISSSICAFGGTLPSIWPFSRTLSMSSSNSPNSIHSPTSTRAAVDSAPIKEESLEDREDRENYEQSLSARYLMKEHCISWDVELHAVIAPPGMSSGKDKRGDIGTPKNSRNKQIGVFKTGEMTPPSYCAPVTPTATPGSTCDTSASRNGTKIKYRCKLCGQPKQNHSCPYESSVVRSIGTMVYPAVNAFVSNEPGRLAPALSEMNNFTSLLSQDTTIAGGGGPAFAAGPYRRAQYPANRGTGGYAGSLLTPDTVHWSPNTPGRLSTTSSVDLNSPSTTPSPGTPGGPPVSSMISSRYQGSNTRRRECHQPLTSRSMTRTMSTPLPTPPAPAGAIPSDVLFRDTMVLQREQFRSVRTSIDSNVVGGGHGTLLSPRAYCYPAIPTPYSQRKGMGDTLFALSREVPKLADSCAAILRDARENDDWDQAVAELTTQVIVVLKCEERDYTLEGLRRHLLALGIAC